MIRLLLTFLFAATLLASCSVDSYDIIIRNGTVYDGSGGPPITADIGVRGDVIAAIGDLSEAEGTQVIDAEGMAVSPGFINMLSWATESLIEDGRSMGDIRQGVTLEVFGEGWSMGPLSPAMKKLEKENQFDIYYDIEWTTLGEYLNFLEEKGVSCNVASFVGATTLRIHTIGYENRPPTEVELDSMRLLVRQAMEEGAIGVGSSLIYAPAFYSSTEELIELCKVAAEYDGMYVSHMRSEGNRILESVDELIRIAAESGVNAEIYHLKAGGEANWPKMDEVIAKVDSARAAGLEITADMYNYTAGATGLDAAMPPWVQEGGKDQWIERLKDPEIRERIINEMKTPTDEWENLMLLAGDPDRVLLIGFKQDSLRHLTGKTLGEASEMMGLSPEETAIELVIRDDTRVGTAYFLMSEENTRKQIALPWVSFCSDAGSMAPEGVFLNSNQHPRAYGNFTRLLGKYVREEKVIPLEEAIRKLTKLPASNMKISNRGELKEGYFADIVIFDPMTIQDHATFAEPHQLATGVIHVFVNGTQVLRDGEHTGALPGRFVRGPGYRK